jgi:hypothetical protein
LAVSQYSIENYNELPHDGRDYILEWIALATQTIGKCFHNRIGSHSDAGCHIERTSYRCATSFYVACPTHKLSSFGVPYKWIPFYGGHGFSGVPSWLKTIIDFEALQCIIGYLHPNPMNAF